MWINILSAIIAAIMSIWFYFDERDGAFIVLLFPVLVTLALMGSVLHMRKTIN